MSTTERMPALYISHGAPPLADDVIWTAELARLATQFEKPKAILVISAHWEDAPLSIGATTTVPLLYDFYGFPQHYYDVQYNAPGAPELAAQVRGALGGIGYNTRDEPTRGLDHGAYVPLVEMYPEADIPVLQISMPTLDPASLLALGSVLSPLRDEGVLIIGSGFTTHNLRGIAHGEPAAWSTDFDAWAKGAVESGDIDSLIDWRIKAPAAAIAHPTHEHWAPLFVSLGASIDDLSAKTAIDGFWLGMSKRSFIFK